MKSLMGVIFGLCVAVWLLYFLTDRISPYAAKTLSTPIIWSGYAPPGGGGHGDLKTPLASEAVGWTIVDYRRFEADGSFYLVKQCQQKTIPHPDHDLDFIHHQGRWYKIRAGTVFLSAKTISARPGFIRWRGILPTPALFPAKNPDIFYRIKIFIDKYWFGKFSPYEYILHLKANIDSCANIPT